ncbi:unnamed protein product, partial [marine sediment metagenome]
NMEGLARQSHVTLEDILRRLERKEEPCISLAEIMKDVD